METKHTPGEWKYEGGDNSSIDIILSNDATISIDRNNRYTDSFAMSREEMEANAKLIASAPEMLEVLQQIIKEYDLCIVNGINAKKIREIITKATE